MRDPFSWSFPIGRLFGITIRVHILFPLFVIGLILRETTRDKVLPGTWLDATQVMFLIFLSVLLHEFGHCFFGRWAGGEASEVMLWPLGGLANVELPHTPRAHFICTVGGPLVNVLIAVGCIFGLAFAFDQPWQVPWNPIWYPYRDMIDGSMSIGRWGDVPALTNATGVLLLERLFWVNWCLFLLNVVLIGFPLDGGRMFQAILWPYVGYRQATLYAVFAGFITMFLLIGVAFFVNDVMIVFLVFFIYTACKTQWLVLESGSEDNLFGYDFSQGYTSLEKDQPPPPRKKQPNFIQRWLQRRQARKLLLEQQRHEEDELRMDQLLEKIAQFGKDSLTDEEQRFLKKVSDRYRNRP